MYFSVLQTSHQHLFLVTLLPDVFQFPKHSSLLLLVLVFKLFFSFVSLWASTLGPTSPLSLIYHACFICLHASDYNKWVINRLLRDSKLFPCFSAGEQLNHAWEFPSRTRIDHILQVITDHSMFHNIAYEINHKYLQSLTKMDKTSQDDLSLNLWNKGAGNIHSFKQY